MINLDNQITIEVVHVEHSYIPPMKLKVKNMTGGTLNN